MLGFQNGSHCKGQFVTPNKPEPVELEKRKFKIEMGGGGIGNSD